MMMTHSFIGLVLGTALVVAPSVTQAKLRVVTTTTDLASLAGSVGGDLAEVEAICQGPQDPHYIQAKPSYMVRLSRADLLISVGLDLEVAWLPSLLQGARNPKINPGKPGYLEAAAAIQAIDVPKEAIDRSQGDVHPFGNPHYLLDPLRAKKIIGLIARRMAELDPSNADRYQQNARTLHSRLDTAIARWTKAMAPYKGQKVVSYHATFNYFFKRFQLDPVDYVEQRPGIPPAPAHLVRLIHKMRAERIRVIFHESYFNPATSEMVAKRAQARVLRLPVAVGATVAAKSYEALIDTLVTRFVAAMGVVK